LAGLRATVITRGASSLAVNPAEHDICDAAQAGSRQFDVVLNLAYPNSGPPYSYPIQNQRIFKLVDSLLRNGSRLIHVSTQAVFGLALDRSVKAGHVAKVRDDAYVEAKIEAEHYFQRLATQKRASLDIVRLGNVWGRSSGAWALPIIQRLAAGRAVGIEGRPGYSNTTDVANAAAYLVHVVRNCGPQTSNARFHHVAEFASVPWKAWIHPLARKLDVDPVYAAPEQLEAHSGLRGEFRAAISPVMPRRMYQQLAGARTSGSWLRGMLRALPSAAFEKLKGEEKRRARYERLLTPEQGFLSVVAARQVFSPVVDPNWTPPLTQEMSLNRVLKWLEER
jgi:nucleoside-diphosphate-sugar epimerase